MNESLVVGTSMVCVEFKYSWIILNQVFFLRHWVDRFQTISSQFIAAVKRNQAGQEFVNALGSLPNLFT